MLLKKKRETNDVLIIDASKGFSKVGKNNVLRASDIKRIADTVISRADTPKFSRLVSQTEIRQNEYNLNIPRYVDSTEQVETWDIYASMFGGIPKAEIALLDNYWKTFKGLKNVLFVDDGSPYCHVAVEDIEGAIKLHASVIEFRRQYDEAFVSFRAWIKDELIGNWETLILSKEEPVISGAIFRRLEAVPIVDRYSAYQALDDEWAKVSADLEILQTEGFSAVKKVVPNMVLKKKDGKDQEIQDGWAGHIIPFALAQSKIPRLIDESAALAQKEGRLTDIEAAYDEIIDSLTEDEKDGDILNEAKDAFAAASVAKKIKELFGSYVKAKFAAKTYDEDSFEWKLVHVQGLIDEEKELKAIVKKDTAALHLHTKDAIECLNNNEAVELLEEKWISPLVTSLKKLPEDILSELVTRVQAMADKYSTTYAEVAGQIAETKTALSNLIDGLTGNEYDLKGLGEFQALLGSSR
jgi:type I restriction enzyme M protein